ncbi:MAG: serine/threonine protein kinase [Sandaracinaceae bacterium]
MRASVSIAFALLALAGCGPGFTLQLPERFVSLTDDPDLRDERYDMRATTSDGVVVGVQRLDHRVNGALTFWSEAVTNRMRDQQGYALLGEDDLTAATGQRGHLMRFARDVEGHAYRYTIALFVTDDHIFVVEAGGREEAYTALEEDIERSIRAMRL